MHIAVGVDGLLDWARAAAALDEQAALDALRTQLAELERTAVQKAQAAAAATGRRAAVVAAETLRGSRSRDRAIVRLGSASVPQAAGENFGARHNVIRQLSNGRQVVGWNQFPEPSKTGGWLYAGGRAALTEIGPKVGAEISKLIENLT